MIHCETLAGTVSSSAANAAGTFTSVRPITGRIIEVRQPGTQFGSTADYTLTRQSDGGTIFAGTDLVGPFSARPAGLLSSAGTAVAGTASQAGIPCASHVQLVIGSAVASAVGTIHIYYEG